MGMLTTTGTITHWRDAEEAAVGHMRSIGFIDARQTKAGPDGGIDVESSEAVAQVKFYSTPVGRPDVQRLRGAAHGFKVAVFYSSGGYTSEARAYADDVGILLFIMRADGTFHADSKAAETFLLTNGPEELRVQLSAVIAEKFRLASQAIAANVRFMTELVEEIRLNPGEAKVVDEGLVGIKALLKSMQSATESHEIPAASDSFTNINSYLVLFNWVADAAVPLSFTDIETAAAAGWLEDEPSGSLSLKAALSVPTLAALLNDTFAGWDGTNDGIPMSELISRDALRAAGLLTEARLHEGLLSESAESALKIELREGLLDATKSADRAFKHISTKLQYIGWDVPRGLIAKRIRARQTSTRIMRYLRD